MTSTAAAISQADPDQQRHVEVAHRVGGDRQQLGAAAPAGAYRLLGAEPGDPGEPRLGAGGQPGHHDQQDARRRSAGVSGWSGPARDPSTPCSARQSSRIVFCRPNISALLVRLLVVVAEQVQHAVDGEELQLLVHGVLGRRAASPCCLATSGHSTMSPSSPCGGSSSSLPGGRSSSIGKDMHVGGPRQVHPLDVQLLHGVGVHDDHRQLGQRVDAHPLERVAGDVEDRLLVDLPSGLVVDVDRHGAVSFTFCRCGRRAGLVAVAAVERLVGVDDTADQLVADHVRRWSAGRSERRRGRRGCPGPAADRSCVPPGRSIWVTSPVTTIFESKPSRVRNIFICSAEVFCASSRMMNASLRVLPRM